ncbi:DNA-binding transcriptional activator of the SARP family [Micromonospora phaseoli]|uniref:DNA-binding transcriptional activator of the SARP family n=1 Tax=Micromonospora phaseoli TaxID=1144548 RepID=A0A1H6YVW5_9ACTN|nr:BTAD domain-containing putative transcriptional regulator [Micromonospora phaseoli]PZW00455.1 DNA-binding SARP family transcriptional activator [Micromonospora phaseoli]GIJ76935.1 SARP family transcriptional regulator [Micromonospora phaseoli]SEJ45371.1 DNA-binding transcriptional activator of the SARP family [Micromonospora phaseoli]
MQLRFDLLGPLTVYRDGQPLDLGSVKQRLLLAFLLARPGEAVLADELVNALWGDQPPASAGANIRTYVRGLRQALDHDGRIVTTPGGYLLRLAPDERDLDRFDAAAGRGRDALASGDPERAEADLAEALALWRGPALAGLPLPRPLSRWVEQLAERRLLAEEDHAGTKLALGASAQVIPRLRTLVDRHPLRQRAWGHLMTGLYHSGDVAGALAAFRRARQVLAEETGMDPGPELTRLHDDILHHRCPPAVPAPRSDRPAAGAARPRPEQLPIATPGFVGRQAQLARLDAAVGVPADGPTTVVISAVCGMAGIGKTALALHWAHRVADRFPDGQLHVNLRGYDGVESVSPADALLGFLEALDVPLGRIPSSLDARIGLYRSLLANREMLIVLDNARDADQVRPLLPGAGRCVVIVTSRDQLSTLVANEGARLLTLDVLTDTESMHLLRSRVDADRLEAEPAAVAEMIEAAGRLPLALSIVAARVATRPTFPLDAIAAELRPPGTRLEVLADGDVRRVFSWSYQALSPDAARLFRLLGLHPGPELSGAAAAALLGWPRAAVTPVVRELTRLHLLTEHHPDRYAFHDLLRSYAAELAQRAEQADEGHQAHRRLYDHYLHSAHPAARLVQPQWTPVTPLPALAGNIHLPMADQDAALAWFAAERHVLLRVIRQAAATGFDAYAWQLAWALTTFLAPRGLWQDQLAAQQAALDAAERLGDLDAQATANRLLGRAASRLGQHDAAGRRLMRAISLYRQLGDQGGLAQTLHNYTEHCFLLGRRDEALTHAREALRLCRLASNRAGEGRALNAIGYMHAVAGNHAQAIADCTAALTQLRLIDDRNGQAATLDSLGFAYHRLGDHHQAVSCYEQSIELFRDSADRYHQAETLTRLGETRAVMGDVAEAAEAWHLASAIYDELGDPAADDARRRIAELDLEPQS